MRKFGRTYTTMIKKIFFTLFLGLALVACKKDTAPHNFHFDYFPLDQGRYVIYSVQERRVDVEVNQDQSFVYFVKAIIGDTLIDNEGRVVRRYERWVGPSQTGPWALQDIWTGLIDGNRAELVEENNRVIKMVFAPTKLKEWDMNAYNTQGTLNCYYRNIHNAYAVGNLSFDSTVVVEQEEFKSLIDYRRKFEVYAKGVGLVYKHYKDFEILGNDSTNIQKGKQLIMSAVEFGVE